MTRIRLSEVSLLHPIAAHVREELFQNCFSIGLVPMLKVLDDSGPNYHTHSNTLLSPGVTRNLPGIRRATGRATFLRKLKKSVNVALPNPNVQTHGRSFESYCSTPFSNAEFSLCLVCGQVTIRASNNL